jgi:general stress protein 26
MGQDENGHARLSELLGKFSTAMVVTRTAEGALRARPMTFAGERDGRLYFATSADSPKVAELESDPRVAITFQDRFRYVSVSGRAEISDDKGLIDRLWQESWRVWFPDGKGDPALRVLSVGPVSAEYWDQSGARGVKHLVEIVKAYATGTTPASGASSDDVKVRV